MPLNVRRFFASILLSLFTFVFISAQSATTPAPAAQTPSAPTTADVMRQRIAKAKAYIVVKNYNAAIYELENIRRETSDANIHAMLNVLLMHTYLEQTDYKRAQAFLDTLYKDLKAKKPNAEMNYYAVAGQIIKGARNQIDRYKSVGLTVSDRNLPLEALVDIEKMRETLEVVIKQSKELGAEKKQMSTALPLLEEALNTRGALAKDEYDANRWRLEIADARENIVKSRSTIINAIDGTSETLIEPSELVAENTSSTTPASAQTVNDQTVVQTPAVAKSNEPVVAFNPVPAADEKPKTVTPAADTTPKTEALKTETEKPVEVPKQNDAVAKTEPRPSNQRRRVVVGQNAQEEKALADKEEPKAEVPAETVADKTDAASNNNMPLVVGSLAEYATKRVTPVYPATARTMRMTGVVKVEIIVDENGNVLEVQNTDGPSLLQRSAVEAVKKWQFKPFMRNGQPTRATGFVNFNFTL